MKILLTVCLFALTSYAQVTNYHASFGLHRDVGLGADIQFGKNLISIDGDVSRICKAIGGCGPQYDIRGVYGHKISENTSLQGGIIFSHYRVPLFAKSSIQILVGVRYRVFNERVIAELNYRHDLTSPNKQRIIESRLTTYLHHHIFIRADMTMKHLVSGGKIYNRPYGRLGIGVYF